MLLPAIGSAVVMTFIRVVGSFGTPAVLGMPVRYYVLPTQIYAAMGTRNAGDGFLLALVLVVLACLFIFINQRLIGVRKSFVTLSGKGFRSKEIDLGLWRWPLFILVMLLMTAAVAFPLVLLVLQSLIKTAGNYSLSNLTLHYWIGGGGEGVDQLQAALVNNSNIIDATWNSLKLAFLTAMTTGIFGFLIGYVVVRTRGSLTSRALEMVAFLPYIFPALAFGAIYIGMFARPFGPIPALYGTFALLVLICSVKTLPFTSRTGIAAPSADRQVARGGRPCPRHRLGSAHDADHRAHCRRRASLRHAAELHQHHARAVAHHSACYAFDQRARRRHLQLPEPGYASARRRRDRAARRHRDCGQPGRPCLVNEGEGRSGLTAPSKST